MIEQLPEATEVPTESTKARRARRYLTISIVVVLTYACTAALISGVAIAFQYFDGLRPLLPIARVLSWPIFDVADMVSALVRVTVAVATRDEALAALVATIPAGLIVFAAAILQATVAIGLIWLIMRLVARGFGKTRT